MVPLEHAAPAEPCADLRDRLLAHRLVLLFGYLDDAAATRAAAQILLLEAEGDDPITVRLDAARTRRWTPR